ncbi:MAG: NAD(P)H-hydrate epimerase, partial [Chloroflexi bacterium]
MKLVTAAQMRALEAAAEAAGTPTAELMQQAGLSAAQIVWRHIDGEPERPVLILVGPGNNGGDGLVAATGLREVGADVHVYLVRPRPDSDEVWRAAQEAGVPATVVDDDQSFEALDALLTDAVCVVDALLGIGASRPLDGAIAEVLDHLRDAREAHPRLLLIALDQPTGVDSDTGHADPHAVAADLTVCFGLAKVGLTQSPGRLLAGDILVAPLELPSAAIEALPY